MNNNKDKIAYSLAGITTILAFVFYYLAKKFCMYVDDIIIIQNVLSLIIIFISIFFIFKHHDDEYKKYIIIGVCIYLVTSFLRLAFMIYNDPSVMHDAYNASPDSNGHLGYILYIYENGKVPMSDGGVLYHPPLYYFLSSIFINIAKIFHYTSYKDIVFIDKIFSFIIVNFTILVIYKMLSYVNISKKMRLLFFSIISAHPIFIRFSGFINNDVLSTFLYVLSIYYLILWYKNANGFNTLFLGVSIAIGTFTKTNMLTFIPFLMVVFIMKLCDKTYRNDKLILKMVISLFIAILPIVLYKYVTISHGKSLSVYNLFAFLDIKKIITYLIGFDGNSYKSIYYGELGTVKGSILPYLLKTEVFMEFTYYNMYLMPRLLFYSNILLTIYSVFNATKVMVINIIHKEMKFDDTFFFILYVMLFGASFYFALLDSRTCTPAFRYIVPIVIPKYYFVVRNINNNRMPGKVINVLILLFIFSSLFIFMKLDMIQDVTLYRVVS